MKSTYRSKTLAVTVACDATAVFAHVANPDNLARWNRGLCRSIRKEGDSWTIETARGRATLRLVRNDHAGVLDQFIRWPDGKVEAIKDAPINQFLVIEEGKGLTKKTPPARSQAK